MKLTIVINAVDKIEAYKIVNRLGYAFNLVSAKVDDDPKEVFTDAHPPRSFLQNVKKTKEAKVKRRAVALKRLKSMPIDKLRAFATNKGIPEAKAIDSKRGDLIDMIKKIIFK